MTWCVADVTGSIAVALAVKQPADQADPHAAASWQRCIIDGQAFPTVDGIRQSGPLTCRRWDHTSSKA